MASTVMDASGNITCTNNTTFYLATTFEDEAGTPIDLTGATGNLQVRTGLGDEGCSSLLLDFSTENGGMIFGVGSVIFTMPVATMALQPTGQYYYDCIIKIGTFSEVYFKGVRTFTIIGGITRE